MLLSRTNTCKKYSFHVLSKQLCYELLPRRGLVPKCIRLYALWACPSCVDFAHVSMVYGGNLTVVPSNRDRVPICFGDSTTISGITPPAYTIALLELP